MGCQGLRRIRRLCFRQSRTSKPLLHRFVENFFKIGTRQCRNSPVTCQDAHRQVCARPMPSPSTITLLYFRSVCKARATHACAVQTMGMRMNGDGNEHLAHLTRLKSVLLVSIRAMNSCLGGTTCTTPTSWYRSHRNTWIERR